MSNLITDVTIGSDPELFVVIEETGEVVTAEPYIKGTKDEPFVFDINNAGFCTSLDNVMAEYTIPSVTSAKEMCSAIFHGVNFINEQLPKGLKTLAVGSAILDEKYLQTVAAKTFGCEADFNVWLRSQNPRPDAKNKQLRTAGGHIHIGYANPTMDLNEKLVKACDIYLGLESILLDNDDRRREMYGKAGCFRFPKHGIEYRVLSNFWIKSTELVEWAFNGAMNAVQFVNNEQEISDEEGLLIQRAINESDKKLAEELIKKYQLQLVA